MCIKTIIFICSFYLLNKADKNPYSLHNLYYLEHNYLQVCAPFRRGTFWSKINISFFLAYLDLITKCTIYSSLEKDKYYLYEYL